MIVGAVAPDDRGAQRLVDLVSRGFPALRPAGSVQNGVAIACWDGPGSVVQPHFGGDHAYVGDVLGEFPEPGAELRGDFALVARADRRLRLARGRFAGRPLFWLRAGDAVIASSHLLPLAIVARSELRLNLAHVFALFDPMFLVLESPLPFLGAHRIDPNTLVDVDADGRFRTEIGPVPFGSELRLSGRELASALREHFRTAVARQCAGARRVAVMTGGGVDSSNLLAVAVDNNRSRGGAEVVPLAFDFGGDGDDRPYLKALCRHLSVEAIRIKPAEGAPYAGLDRVIDGSAHALGPATTMFAATARAKAVGVDRILEGGGSELFLDAEAAVFSDFLLRQPIRALRCLAHFKTIGETRTQLWRRVVAGPLLRQMLPADALEIRHRIADRKSLQVRRRNRPWAEPRLSAFLGQSRRYPSRQPIMSQRERVQSLASSRVLMTMREHASRWEVGTGLAISFPYLDDDFVQFLGRVPSEAIFEGGRERGLLRESMEGLVPDSVRYRMDKARPNNAFAELFEEMQGAVALEDLLSMRELRQHGFVDPDRFAAAFDRFANDPRANPADWSNLWGAITAEAYLRWFRSFQADSGASSLPCAAMVPV